MSDLPQLLFTATLNVAGTEKIIARGFVPRRQVPTALRFYEDDLNSARAFFRRYCRNFYGVKLTNGEFSVYQVIESPPSRMGFLEDPNEALQRKIAAEAA